MFKIVAALTISLFSIFAQAQEGEWRLERFYQGPRGQARTQAQIANLMTSIERMGDAELIGFLLETKMFDWNFEYDKTSYLQLLKSAGLHRGLGLVHRSPIASSLQFRLLLQVVARDEIAHPHMAEQIGLDELREKIKVLLAQRAPEMIRSIRDPSLRADYFQLAIFVSNAYNRGEHAGVENFKIPMETLLPPTDLTNDDDRELFKLLATDEVLISRHRQTLLRHFLSLPMTSPDARARRSFATAIYSSEFTFNPPPLSEPESEGLEQFVKNLETDPE